MNERTNQIIMISSTCEGKRVRFLIQITPSQHGGMVVVASCCEGVLLDDIGLSRNTNTSRHELGS